ncbi:MAG: hypothetical protein AAFR79_08795 [Pseudomonadota bacterium]
MTAPGMGHNAGPRLEPGRRWRTYCWTRAKRDGLPKAPLELVKRHVKRAAALGLSYPRYAAVRLGTGRDLAALLFTGAALGLRWGRVRDAEAAHLLALEGPAERLLLAGRGVPVEGFWLDPLYFEAAGPLPAQPCTAAKAGKAIRAVTGLRRLPGDTVLLVGRFEDQKPWSEAARLAGFMTAEEYFAPQP